MATYKMGNRMKELKIRKEIEIEKWKNLSKQLSKELEYLLDEIEDLKKQLKDKKQ
jgi:predicted  nucleic acid-binding Zn-ribbon protein